MGEVDRERRIDFEDPDIFCQKKRCLKIPDLYLILPPSSLVELLGECIQSVNDVFQSLFVFLWAIGSTLIIGLHVLDVSCKGFLRAQCGRSKSFLLCFLSDECVECSIVSLLFNLRSELRLSLLSVSFFLELDW